MKYPFIQIRTFKKEFNYDRLEKTSTMLDSTVYTDQIKGYYPKKGDPTKDVQIAEDPEYKKFVTNYSHYAYLNFGQYMFNDKYKENWERYMK